MFILLLILSQIATQTFGLKFSIPNEAVEKNNDYWYSVGKEDIEFALHRPFINGVAKNIIIFVGDGMGNTVTTAGRIYKGQKKGSSGEEGNLVWEKFPNIGQMKTYNLDRQVADSAGTATAYFGGVKGNYYTIGVNGGTKQKDCKASLLKSNRVTSILDWCQKEGKETGFVTTTRVTHATPAGLYAHSADRDWECDARLKADGFKDDCKDIALQLVEELPGRDIKLILAGGRRAMGATVAGDGGTSCLRNDSRNLAEEWKEDKKKRGKSFGYATNTQEFRSIDLESTEFIMGLFGGNHMPYEYARNKGPEGTPSIKELTEAAIKRLSKSDKGFFLMVEGGRIDHALHDTKPNIALEELVAFEEAVAAAVKLVNIEETLIIVTADHSHVMTMNGYPERGNDILGITTYEDVTDDLPYTTLMFTNGFGANFTWDGKKVVRANLTGVNTRDPDFISQSAVPTKDGYETHGGEDVLAYAVGPASHLFHRVHEQSYVAHVMGFAACVGPFKDKCARPSSKTAFTYQVSEIKNENKSSAMSSSERTHMLTLLLVCIALISHLRFK